MGWGQIICKTSVVDFVPWEKRERRGTRDIHMAQPEFKEQSGGGGRPGPRVPADKFKSHTQ